MSKNYSLTECFHYSLHIFKHAIIVYMMIGILCIYTIDSRFPNLLRFLSLKGTFYSSQNAKNYKFGSIYFYYLTKTEPNNAEAWAGLGSCYFNVGKSDKAVSAYQKAIEINPRKGEYYFGLFEVYNATNNFAEADKIKKIINSGNLFN